MVWFGSVGYHNSFIFRVHLSHLMNVRHGILNFNCCNAAIALLLLLLFAVPNGVYVQNSKCTAFGMPTEIGWNCVSVYSASNDERERARISLPFSESIYVILCMCARVAAAATAAELYGPCLVCTSSIHAQYLLKFYIYSLTSSFLLTLFGWAFGYMYVSLWIFAQDIVFTDASSACFSPFFPLSSTHFSSFTIFFFALAPPMNKTKKNVGANKVTNSFGTIFFPHFIFSPIPFFNT